MMNRQSASRSCKVSRALGCVQILNEGEEDELICTGYKNSALRRLWLYILVVLSLGFIFLLMHWKPRVKLALTKTVCPLTKADAVLLVNNQGSGLIEVVHILYIENSAFPTSYHAADINHSTSSNEEQGVITSDTTCLLSANEEEPIMGTKYFDYQHTRYIWNAEQWTFIRLRGLDHDVTCSSLSTNHNGLSLKQQQDRRKIYGENAIDIQVKSYWKLFIEEVLNPFYIFQMFSTALWFSDGYYYYAGCIILISAISIMISLYETKKQRQTLAEKFASNYMEVSTCRGNNVWEMCSTRDIVPGDLIFLQHTSASEIIMPCDAVILFGNAIVNESMLTGESVPEKKFSLICHNKEEKYSVTSHKRNTLFSGTRIIQTSGDKQHGLQALVLRTGYSTTKGDLVRSILYPKDLSFELYRDAIRFVLIMSLISACGMSYSIVILILNHVDISKIVIRALDIITIAVPPALPAAMTVGTVYAQSRLKKQNIFCISPPRINVCGKLNLFCFDKTGTLTEDGLDMWGVVPVTDCKFAAVHKDPKHLPAGHMINAMATCHSLVTINGKISGDPLDKIMFESIGWIIESTSRYGQLVDTVVTPMSKDMFRDDDFVSLEIATLKEFPFSSELQRMSVITQSTHNERMVVYCKGAPEKISSLCLSHTVPEDFPAVLHKFTVQGFRVIAVAYKQLKSSSRWHQVLRMSRDDVEKSLHFGGLVILQNALKVETTPIISQLRAANIRTVMVTGDNILTAVSVARKCGMASPSSTILELTAVDADDGSPPVLSLSPVGDTKTKTQRGDEEIQITRSNNNMDTYHSYHFAISGKSFHVLFTKCPPSLLYAICVKGVVFARMSPNQKQALVESLQDLGYSVGMCGDGANDCGALKTAHAGISLSEEEASVASPFTSKMQNIQCVPTLIREGRAALVTSFGCFKYMALYSMIQFVSVLILYWYETNLSDMMFIYVDLLVTTTVAVLMSYTAAYPHLVRQQPQGSLINSVNLTNIVTQIAVVCVFQVFSLLYMERQRWYIRVTPLPTAESVACYESTAIFFVSVFQYITMAFVFSKGPPFRKRIWTNWMFFLSLIFLVVLTVLLMWIPPTWTGLRNFLLLKTFPSSLFNGTLLLLAVLNLGISFTIEYVLEDTPFIEKLCCMFGYNTKREKKYEKVERQLAKLQLHRMNEALNKLHFDV